MTKEKLTPVEKRIAIARTWAARIKKMTDRKKNPKSEAEFCRDNGFDFGLFNRNKNLRVVPTQRTVDRIEKALKKEGI
jgi:hypothetical protein